ncbi:MAG TPA: ABC transporter substrate-binding protein [Lacunisphaera sp.]|jgi:branched-chain amino acid transport system substrate-binding protein|nr:ABC transporter substrate-binding protein [Lacunisphaera sp.]
MPIRSLPQMLRSVFGTGLLVATLAAQEPIRIGEFASLTGKEATFGQTVHKGTVLAIEEANAAAGALGRPLELLTEDDQSKPGESATVVKKLISRDKVVAILGELTSGRTLEAAPIAQAARIPLISPGATAVEVTAKGNYIFRICFIDEFQGTVMAQFALDTLKVRRVAILSSVSSAQSVGLAKFFRERVTQGGGTVVLEQRYGDGDKDFRAQLTAIKAAGVDAVFVPGYYTEAALIAKQARELGLAMPLLGIDGWESSQLIAIGGAAVEGAYLSTHYSAENQAPGVLAFNERFRARWGEDSNALSALAYDAALVLIDALKRAGTTDGPALRAALAATRDFPGATGRITFDAQRNPTKSAVVLTVKNGRFVFVQDVHP